MNSGITKKSTSALITILLAMAFLVLPAQVMALESEDMRQQQHQQQVEVTEEQVSAFANTQLQLLEIQQQLDARMQQVADEQEQEAIIRQANEDMIDVIEDEGLGLEEYNLIASQAQVDPELMQRIENKMN